MTLAHLTWGHGLPAGVHEVQVINRMRIKRAWEAILPPMDTPANIKMRNSIITALEIDEWAFRESVSVSKHEGESQSFISIRLPNVTPTFLPSLIIILGDSIHNGFTSGPNEESSTKS